MKYCFSHTPYVFKYLSPFISTTSSADSDVTSTTSSYGSALDDTATAMTVQVLIQGNYAEEEVAGVLKATPKRVGGGRKRRRRTKVRRLS